MSPGSRRELQWVLLIFSGIRFTKQRPYRRHESTHCKNKGGRYAGRDNFETARSQWQEQQQNALCPRASSSGGDKSKSGRARPAEDTRWERIPASYSTLFEYVFCPIVVFNDLAFASPKELPPIPNHSTLNLAKIGARRAHPVDGGVIVDDETVAAVRSVKNPTEHRSQFNMDG